MVLTEDGGQALEHVNLPDFSIHGNLIFSLLLLFF